MNERERGLHTLEGAPLGPDSLLWKLMDNRLLYAGLPAGILQLMYKTIGKGVEDHSNFANEPLERVIRSMEPITETVFGTEESSRAAGAKIVGFHHTIKGTHEDGSRYHAMDPQVWADTHLTFVYPIFQIAERFDRKGLTYPQKQQLYKECITWYQNYPVSDKYLPADYEGYKKRWQELCDNEFRLDADIAGWTLDFAKRGEIPRLNIVPEEVWGLMKLPLKPVGDVMGKLIIAGIPERVRKNNNIRYSFIDKQMVQSFENLVKYSWDVLDPSVKYPPQAFEAFKRERAKRGESTLRDHVHTLGFGALKSSFGMLTKSIDKARSLNPLKQ